MKHIHKSFQLLLILLDQSPCFLTETAPSSLQTVAQLFAGRVPALQITVIVGVAAGRRIVAEGNADAALVLGWTVATVQTGLHFDLVGLAFWARFLSFRSFSKV